MTEQRFDVRLIYFGGLYSDIKSPIPADQLYRELTASIMENSSRPDWDGWFQFKKADGKFIALIIRNIVGVEEI